MMINYSTPQDRLLLPTQNDFYNKSELILLKWKDSAEERSDRCVKHSNYLTRYHEHTSLQQVDIRRAII